MKKIKVLMSFILILSLGFSLMGCSQNESNTNDTIENKSEEEASVDNSWKRIEDNGKLVVGLCAAYPPFESRNEKTGEFEGFDIDLAKALGKELNVDVEIKDAEWQALLGGLNKGDFDVLITCMSKKEAAVENVNMSDVYYQLNNVVVVKKDEENIKNPEDLKDKIVGVQLGSGSEQVADKMEGLKEIKRYNYNPEAFIDLENDRIDGIIVGYAYAVNHLKQGDKFKIIDKPVASADIVMVMKNGENNLTAKLNESLSKIKENGEYDKILENWLTIK
ncbi:substrate-binding periplasmic protein [Maledivibacter halophilus]|uniref:Amino acid ABC transporter substrate-binding protein, PAAT family n=1 Tax=Maledivibacter halophilus TaxID=36842 RepID=A0A1T5IN31_9FIRM|nr:ABC transporter substrate-binding protein [Maledivibacter halophilus]SKC40591.1 amino acid ABC transporter substrate-binding protein, PAAT family [Maledivibacter halophilus]